MLPFHIRYQPAGPHDSSEILIPSPEVNFIQPSGEIESEYGDPFYLTVPVANTKHLFLVNFSTLFAAVFGALYLAREILRKWKVVFPRSISNHQIFQPGNSNKVCFIKISELIL